MKILKLTGAVLAAALVTLASCTKEDTDDTNETITYDCPDLEADIEDPCELNVDNTLVAGFVNANCECEPVDTGGDFDCPDLQANFEDACELMVDNEPVAGFINANCECQAVETGDDPDCPDFYYPGWSDGNYGDPCETPDVPWGGVISEDCECVFADDFCVELFAYVGDPCSIEVDNITLAGAVSADCECVVDDPAYCTEVENTANGAGGIVGGACTTTAGEPGTISGNCACVASEFCDEVTNLASWYPLEFPNGVELSIGDPCWNSNDEQSTVNENCECE